LRRLNPILRGWASYFRYAAATHTFSYLGYYAWWRRMSRPLWKFGGGPGECVRRLGRCWRVRSG
jgi:hypothetical protein